MSVDIIAAAIIGVVVYIFGGFVIGFLGALIGIEKSISAVASIVLVVALPIIYLVIQAKNHTK